MLPLGDVSYLNSSDVIQDMRINVSEENSDTILWYKVGRTTKKIRIQHIYVTE